jgi:hypothetical protein
MFSFSKPCKSRLTEKEYNYYKAGLEEVLKRYIGLDIPVPRIGFDDKTRHIFLFSFRGCVSGTTITVPDGITIVFAIDDDSRILHYEKPYTLVLSDTVQSVDALPKLRIQYLDTNKAETFRLKDSKFYSDGAEQVIENVVVREQLREGASVGHILANNVYYALNKSYQIGMYPVFNAIDNLFVDKNCDDIKTGINFQANIIYCGCERKELPYENKVIHKSSRELETIISSLRDSCE